MIAMSEFILYSYFRSSASYRVRIALNLKNIAYEYRAVHLLNNGGEQRSDEYRKLNPSEQVPTLIHKGRALGQSMAIVEYLDSVHPSPRLFSEDAFQKALVIQACEIVNSGVQPLHNLIVLQELGKRFSATDEQKNDWTAFWIQRSLLALENFLQPHAGDFCFGHAVTAADCFLMPHLANADRFKVSLAPYPTLKRVRANCDKLAAFQKAAPGVQPDTPANF
jgi:maleylacetoacetate isomerase